MDRERVALSKTMAHALRHAPWVYELELDHEGWVRSRRGGCTTGHRRTASRPSCGPGRFIAPLAG